ncbi:hypothetical protein AX17_004063 [Amanita inopinata Kibby_2008]|nr:hypothetical protein AX17_004063 [Amanita inopinata Kibby_2008]
MLIRPSPSLATATTLCLTLLTLACRVLAAQDESYNNNGTQPSLICTPFGTCESCPEDALHEPFCRPFGNRRLMHCVNATTADKTAQSTLPGAANGTTLNHEEPEHPEGETLAWESCGRIPSRERGDFYEFIACNILFALISLVVLFARSRRLQAIHARQLAARIGLTRDTGRR